MLLASAVWTIVLRACGTKTYLHTGESNAQFKSVCAKPDLGGALLGEDDDDLVLAVE